jgi:hypothetical protein
MPDGHGVQTASLFAADLYVPSGQSEQIRSEVYVLGVDSRCPAAQLVSGVNTRSLVSVLGVDSQFSSKLANVSGEQTRSLVFVLSVERHSLL